MSLSSLSSFAHEPLLQPRTGDDGLPPAVLASHTYPSPHQALDFARGILSVAHKSGDDAAMRTCSGRPAARGQRSSKRGLQRRKLHQQRDSDRKRTATQLAADGLGWRCNM